MNSALIEFSTKTCRTIIQYGPYSSLLKLFGNNKYIDDFIIDRTTLYHQLILFGFLSFLLISWMSKYNNQNGYYPSSLYNIICNNADRDDDYIVVDVMK